MSLKDMLRVYPHDKLSHYQWASWLSTPVGILILAAGLVLLGAPIAYVAAAASAGTMLAALALGLAGEWLDRKANEAADLTGSAPPHQVSWGDVNASALGGLPAALPLAVIAALTWPK